VKANQLARLPQSISTFAIQRRFTRLAAVRRPSLPGADRSEILGRYLGLRNGEIKLGFHTLHQIDYIDRGQPDIHRSQFRIA
jgi:hypothetical protein